MNKKAIRAITIVWLSLLSTMISITILIRAGVVAYSQMPISVLVILAISFATLILGLSLAVWCKGWSLRSMWAILKKGKVE